MGKFSYKKRKGTRKQTFKNRKKIKKGGDPETPATETPAPTAETPAPTAETPLPTAKTSAPTAETPAPTAETPEPTVETPVPKAETPTPPTETETPATEAPAPTAETKEVQQNQNVTNSGSTAEGSYTSDDAGYQKFIENIKTNPEILNNVVFVNAGLSQIFLKQGDSWTEIKK